MSIEEFYIAIGHTADNIIDRLGDKFFIKKFIVKFLNDKTFENLKEDIENKNLEKANFDAHTFKGVCAVLDFIKLKKLTEQLMLCLKDNDSYDEIWQMITNEYNLIIQTIKNTNWEV